MQFLNEAQRKICWEGAVLLTSATASTVASQEAYSLPSDYLKMDCVFLYQSSGSQVRLLPIDTRRRDPTKSTGTPAYYFIHGINVSGANSYFVGLNPIPSSSGTNDVEIYYHQLPLTMVGGGQGPEVPIQWQDALPAYACWRIYQRLGKGWESQRDEAHAEWQDWVNKAKRYVNPLMRDLPHNVTDDGGYFAWGNG